MLGVDEVMNEWGEKNFPIELVAATTLGSSVHIGTIYFLLLISSIGTTPRGRESLPITFSMILSPCSLSIPPFFSRLSLRGASKFLLTNSLLQSMLILWKLFSSFGGDTGIFLSIMLLILSTELMLLLASVSLFKPCPLNLYDLLHFSSIDSR